MFELVKNKQIKKPRQPNTFKRDMSIAKDHIEKGMVYKDLAAKYGVSTATISYILNRDEVRDVVNTALTHLASFSPIVVRNYEQLLNSKSESIRWKATEGLAKLIGLYPSHTPSQINMLYVQQGNISGISEAMQELITKIGDKQDFIDAEFEEINSD